MLSLFSMKRLQSAAGFTLIELLIVLSILGILLTLAQPNYRKATIKAREAALKQDLATFRDVIDQYYSDHGAYPPSLVDLKEEGYLRRIPEDPFTQSSGTWIEIYMEGDDQTEGVYDVHSASDLLALDGTPYNEW